MTGKSFKFSIGKKILLGFFILIFMYMAMALHGYSDMNEIGALTEQVVPLSSQVSSLQDFAISLESMERDIDKFFKVGYKEDQEEANKDLEKMHSIIRSLENNADSNSAAKYQEIEKLLTDIQINFNYLANLEQNSNNSREINEKRILVYELIDSGRQKHRELLSETADKIRVNVLDQQRVISEIIKEFLILGISILVIGVIISFLTSKSISQPIDKLRAATSEIGHGHLNVIMPIQSNDEVGQLTSAFNRMTEELQKTTVSRDYVDNIIRSMFDTLIVTAPDGIIQTANRATCDLLGYRTDELVGKPVDTIFADETLQPRNSWLDELIKKGSISGIEKVYLAKDGGKIPTLLSGSTMRDDNGNIQGIIFVAQDITEHKRAEMNIIRLNRVYSVLSNINQAIVRTRDQQMLFKEACHIAVEHGLFKMAWIGLIDTDRLEVRTAMQSGFVEEILDNIRISIRDVPEGCGSIGNAILDRKHFICNDIEHDQIMEPWCDKVVKQGCHSSSAFPLLVGGRVAGAFMVFASEMDFFDSQEIHLLDELAADISFALESIELEKQRKQAEDELRMLEKRYRSTLDSMLEGCQIIGFDWRYLYVNDAVVGQGRRAKEELLGRTMMEIYPGIENTAMFVALEQCMEKRTSHRMEYEFTFQDGSKSLFELSVQPAQDGIFILSLDITGRKNIEQIRLENMRLALASRAKSEFLANMSHELRTPLNSIIGFSELLQQNSYGELNEKQNKYVSNVLTSSKFLLNLINDILDLSKIEAGKIELMFEKVPVHAVINETLTLIKEKASKHNVLLNKEFDPALNIIEADQQRFKQILFNLLSNAVKFSKKEGGTVTVTTKKEGDMAKISVSDTGIGIKDEDLGRLFKEFEQLDSGISRKYGGTGLGLAISKKLVELHGGRIWVESRFVEGSKFTVLLPIVAKKGSASNEN